MTMEGLEVSTPCLFLGGLPAYNSDEELSKGVRWILLIDFWRGVDLVVQGKDGANEILGIG